MNYYNEIKNKLIDNEVHKRVKDYSMNLTKDLNIKYTKSSLYNMIKFYKLSESIIFQTLSGKLLWSHYCELLPLKD